MVSPLILN
uniref:Uncharacterized protein n=1 Tax=Rhizophora mucronata TaxID=61149 RepID=A0A2P2N6M6_RHIMU